MPKQDGPKKLEIPYKFRTMDLAALKPHPKQAEVREISDEALKRLDNFIGTVGMVEEILINKRTGHIISGHQRRRVLLAQGYETAKIKVVDVPRKVEDMMFINLNSQAISGNFTAGAVEFVMSLEAKLGSDIYQDVGLSMLEVELGGARAKEKEGLTDPDDIPATPKKATTKLGDLYQLGNHRLLCGDATKKEDVERLMDGQKADMVFTDPPYGVGYTGGAKKRDALVGDEIGTTIYGDALPHLRFAASDRAALYLWYADAHAAAAAAAAAGYEITAQVIWVKNNAQFVTSAHYKGKHEPCYYAHRKGKAAAWYGQNNEVTVWECDRAVKNEFHPTQKPVALAIRAISNSSKSSDIILDIFGGSGSTLIASEQSGRHCRMMEIDPLYCDVIVKRWEEFTGNKAKKLKRM